MHDRGTLLRRTAALACLALTWPSPGAAALRAVSGAPDPELDPNALTEVVRGGAKEDVAYSLAHGFPLWFQDESGLKLELCLDQQVARRGGGTFFPCVNEEAFSGAPVSFPSNFAPESFYWTATAAGAFTSLVNGQPVVGRALLVLGQEAAFLNGLTIDGQQVAFGRIRIRIDAPVAGRYRVTHPYGDLVYEVAGLALGDDREIDEAQDVGNLALAAAGPPPAGNYVLALDDGPDPGPMPTTGYPALGSGIVSSQRTGIGPFLVPAGDPLTRIVAFDGNRDATYLADPGAGDLHNEVPVAGSPFDTNFFRIELLEATVPEGTTVVFNSAVDAADPNVVVFDRFQVAAKLFDDGPNRAPSASDDVAATAMGRDVLVDVIANDADVVDGALNVHGLNPQAIALPSDVPGAYLLTRAQLTEQGGVVRRATDFRTGRARFRYTPPSAAFTGIDRFRYVVQDTGGLVSEPATVTLTVEDLAVATAEYRPRTGKWRVAGTSSDREENAVAIFGAPRASLAAAGGVSSAATGAVTLRITPDAIHFRLSVEPLPSTPVTRALLHVVAAGQGGEGPPVFALYDRTAPEPAFTGAKSGTLTDAHRIFGTAQVEAGIGSIADVVAAILAGDAYVTVSTEQHPASELRAPVVLAEIGAAPVDPVTGQWSFAGKSVASPGRAPANVNARSSNGVWTTGIPLEVR